MTTSRVRRLFAVAAVTVTVTAGIALVAPAPPALADSCQEGSGVTVVVDFAGLGGGVQTRCAAGDPSSGVEALRSAGFSPTRAAQEPGYFVCRINGKPTDDPCQRASPSSAYWSYWHGRPGGSWSYSGTGPASYNPGPGEVEGWAFGAGNSPSVRPPAAAPKPAPPPTSAPPPTADAAPAPAEPGATAPRASAPRRPVTATNPPPATTAASPTSEQPAVAAAPTPGGTPLTSPSAAATPSTPAGDRRTDGDGDGDGQAGRASTRTDDGSPAGVIAAAGLVALLAAGGWQAWRRRRLDETT